MHICHSWRYPGRVKTAFRRPNYRPKPALRASLADKNWRECVSVEFLEHAATLIASPGHLHLYKGTQLAWVMPWCEVQRISWNEEASELIIEFTDPSLAPLSLENPLSDNLTLFGNRARASLAAVQIASLTERTDSGAILIAVVRKGPDGQLFSAVIAPEELTAAEQARADALESRVRVMTGMFA